jgi:hypothetical protein
MNPRQMVTRGVRFVVVIGALLGTASLAQAREGEAADDRARAIEGVWLPLVTITDCATHAVIATFASMDLYVRGGGFVGFGAVSQSDQVGFGGWKYAGGRRYTAEYQFFNYTPMGAPDGTPDGTLLKVSATIQLNAAGTAFTSSETADIVDAGGNVYARICGARTATRLQ